MPDRQHTPETEISPLFGFCTSMIANEYDYAAFASAVRAAAGVLMPLPPAGALVDDPDLHERLVLTLARALWKVTPHPKHRFVPGPMPTSSRNDPCHCGSGRKYKRCCMELDQTAPQMDVNMLPELLTSLPQKRWKELVGSRVDIDLVAHCAWEWQRDGLADRVEKLLDPWFSDDRHFTGKYEPLMTQLLDAYTELHRPVKKSRLLKRAEEFGDREVKASAVQRRVSIAADTGDYTLAWELFRKAQRMDPDSPSLTALEVTVLAAEGRDDEARQRADFHARRLTAKRDPELDEQIDFLRRFAQGGASAMSDLVAEHEPVFRALLDAIRTAPPVASAYRLEPDHESAGPLMPRPPLEKALRQWRKVAPSIAWSPLQFADGDDIPDDPEVWIELLREMPVLWNCFDVVHAVLRALDDFAVSDLDESLERTLLERAEAMLTVVLKDNAAEQRRLEWGFLENRPALALIGELIAADLGRPATDEHVARLEWMVQRLNPNDNGGFRIPLSQRYLETGRYADALALAASYPDDLAAMQYNHALALFASGDPEGAEAALRQAAGNYPKPLVWLLKKKARAPRMDGYGLHVGGDDEAWVYRQDTLPLWTSLGALDWARRIAKAIGVA